MTGESSHDCISILSDDPDDPISIYSTSEDEDAPSEPCSDDDGNSGSEDDSFLEPPQTAAGPRLSEVVMDAAPDMGDAIDLSNFSRERRWITLVVSTSQLKLHHKQALGLAAADVVNVRLSFQREVMGKGPPPEVEVSYAQPEPKVPQRMLDAEGDEPEGEEPGSPEALKTVSRASSPKRARTGSGDPLQDQHREAYLAELRRRRRCSMTRVGFQLASLARAWAAASWDGIQSYRAAAAWLPQLHAYLRGRLPTLGNHCIICDAEQPLKGLKPVVCVRDVCTYQYDEMGFGAGLDEVYEAGKVVDLLLTCASAAASAAAEYRDRLFGRPPSDFLVKRAGGDRASASGLDVSELNNLHAVQAKVQWDDVLATFSQLPAVYDMAVTAELEQLLGPQAYRLVRWVLATCRGHLVELDKPIQQMGGSQFRLHFNTPERELAFQRLKRTHGSYYAFHGSAFHNWHSILRTCLLNCSGTKLQRNGAVHGSGIYLSRTCATAMGYCHSRYVAATPAFANSAFGGEPRCVALCEVANKDVKDVNWALVAQDENCVAVRYLFVYSHGQNPPSDIMADQLELPPALG